MKIFKTVVCAAVVAICATSCFQKYDPTTLVGVWDMSGKEQTEFSSRFIVFDETSYMWMADKVYRYRYSEEGGRPMLHIDGDYQKDFHLIKIHTDTLLITDGKTPYGTIVKSPLTAMQTEYDVAYDAIAVEKEIHAKALRDQLEEGRIYIKRRYK